MLSARETDLQLDAVDDKRAAHLIKWPLDVVLRIAYNLLALLRSVTMRAEHTRDTPWKTVMRWIELALWTAGPNDVARLRPRTAAAAGAS